MEIIRDDVAKIVINNLPDTNGFNIMHKSGSKGKPDNVGQIIGLLSKDFLKLIVVACVIAFPFGYWGMNQWLQDFAYRIEISWWVFLVAGVSALAIALLTVSFQSIKAALMNPVKSLKTE